MLATSDDLKRLLATNADATAAVRRSCLEPKLSEPMRRLLHRRLHELRNQRAYLEQQLRVLSEDYTGVRESEFLDS